MSNEFLERLKNGSLTQIDQHCEMRNDLAPAANRLARGVAVGDDWKDWELAPEWSAESSLKQKTDEQLIGGASADKLRGAINMLERSE